MIKRIFIVLLAALFFAFAGCSTSATTTQDAVSGTYASSGSDTPFVAVVEKGVITINIESDGSKALYWKGTFVVPDNDGKKFTVDSKADVEALKESMFGSQDANKVFTYDGGKLSYEFGMMGVTTTVALIKK